MFLIIDKPKDITSHDVVDKVRKITEERKVGHAGTLDPNATGLLIVAVGRESTKKLKILSGKDKEYDAEIYLGEERDTDDVQGEVIAKAEVNFFPRRAQVEKALKNFVGMVMQTPPNYSAIKIKGRKAYELSRKGKKPKLEPRKVKIYGIKLISYNYPKLTIKVKVSSGTYIRSLARDIGRELGCYAYLNNLRRVSIGKYSISSAVSMDKLNKDNWKNYVVELD